MDKVIRKRGRPASGVRSVVYYRRVPESKHAEVHLAVEGVLLGHTAAVELADERALSECAMDKVAEFDYKLKLAIEEGERLEAENATLRAESAMLKAENERLIAAGVGVDGKMRAELDRCKAKIKEYERMYNGS